MEFEVAKASDVDVEVEILVQLVDVVNVRMEVEVRMIDVVSTMVLYPSRWQVGKERVDQETNWYPCFSMFRNSAVQWTRLQHSCLSEKYRMGAPQWKNAFNTFCTE